jgi:hypothetical protein
LAVQPQEEAMTFVQNLRETLFGLFFGNSNRRKRSLHRRTTGRAGCTFRPRLESLIEVLEPRIPMAVDLAPYAVFGPASAPAGSTVNIQTGVSNYGNTASGGYYVNFYASSDANITTSDVYLKTAWWPSQGPWSSSSSTENVTLPSWMTGNWFVGVVVDPWGYVSETNKGNNSRAAYNATMIAAPTQIDLSPYNVSVPASAPVPGPRVRAAKSHFRPPLCTPPTPNLTGTPPQRATYELAGASGPS